MSPTYLHKAIQIDASNVFVEIIHIMILCLSLSLSIAVYDTMYLQSFLINKRHVYIVHPPPLEHHYAPPKKKWLAGN